VARGDVLYNSLACSSCHGPLGLGGAAGAADLTKSALAQTPDNGRTLAAFLQVGRPEQGMPPARPLSPQEAADLSAKIRSLAPPPASRTAADGARAAAPALPAALAGQDLSIVIGDPKIGKAYFNSAEGRCSTCHAVEDGKASPAANLAHVASKYKAEKDLQQTWMLPGRDVNWSPRKDNTVTAVATFADGHEVRGYLTSISDFKLVIRDDAGKVTTIPRADDQPKVRLIDRMQPHLDLMDVYQDDDIHNITAYLATLK
jgi:cytochrome c oxidase cbb3-type subunit 3